MRCVSLLLALTLAVGPAGAQTEDVAPDARRTFRVPPSEPAFSCTWMKTCSQMRFCAEACHQFAVCGYGELDGDSDDIPCEGLCSSPCPTDDDAPLATRPPRS